MIQNIELYEKINKVIDLLNKLVKQDPDKVYVKLLNIYMDAKVKMDSGDNTSNIARLILFTTRRFEEAPPADYDTGFAILNAISQAEKIANNLWLPGKN